jgi:hypothetical protein
MESLKIALFNLLMGHGKGDKEKCVIRAAEFTYLESSRDSNLKTSRS